MFGRVMGRLAVTRALGDFECKQIEITDEQTGEVKIKNFVLSEPRKGPIFTRWARDQNDNH